MIYLASVRYGRTWTVENFATVLLDLKEEEKCIVRSDRGLELGEVVSPPEPLPEGLSPEIFPALVRVATFDDLMHAEETEAKRLEAKVFAQEEASRLRLPVDILDTEWTFGRERLLVTYVKNGLADVSPLLDRLAQRYGTRVEFEQVALKDAGGGG